MEAEETAMSTAVVTSPGEEGRGRTEERHLDCLRCRLARGKKSVAFVVVDSVVLKSSTSCFSL